MAIDRLSPLDLSRCVACEELTRYVYDHWHDVEGGIIERDDGGDSGRGILGGLSARLTSHRSWEQKRRYPLVSFPVSSCFHGAWSIGAQHV